MKKIQLPQHPFFIPIILFLATVLMYFPVLRAGFTWDELNLLHGQSLFFPPLESALYRPMYNVSMALDNMIWGTNPLGFHLTSLLLHACNAILVFVLGKKLLASDTAAIMASLIFVAHPLSTEAVSLVLGRDVLLMTFFSLISFLLYFSYREQKQIPPLVASALFFVLALLCGQGAVSVVLIIALYELQNGLDKRRAISLAVAFALASVAYAFIFSGAGALSSGQEFLFTRLIDAVTSMGYYIWKLMFPFNFQFLPDVSGSILLLFVVPAYLGIAILLLSEGYKKTFYAALMLPALLLPVAMISLTAAQQSVAERYAYMSIVFFALMLSMALSAISKSSVRMGVISLLLLLFVALTFSQNMLWKNSAKVWQTVASQRTESSVPYHNLGAVLIRDGHYLDGNKALGVALEHNDISFESIKKIMLLLAKSGGSFDGKLFKVLTQKSSEAEANFVMGFMHFDIFRKDQSQKEHLQKSVAFLNSATALNPGHHEYQYYMGVSLLASGDITGAKSSFKASVASDKSGQYTADINYYFNVIESLRQEGKLEQFAPVNSPAMY
jgi:hypothetical protein